MSIDSFINKFIEMLDHSTSSPGHFSHAVEVGPTSKASLHSLHSELQLFKFGQTQEEKFRMFCFLFFATFLSLTGYMYGFISTVAKVLTKTPSIMKLFLRKHG